MQEVLEQRVYVIMGLYYDNFCIFMYIYVCISHRYEVPTSKFDVVLMTMEINFLSQKKPKFQSIDATQLASYLSNCYAKQVAETNKC